MRRLRLLLVSALALSVVGCGGGSSSGGRADARTATATLNDDMSVVLSESEFAVGETVLFEVTNAGAVRHELYLGDAEAQQDHAEEMAEMDGMSHDEPGGVSVEPGATATLEYTFEEAGEILAGCHEPGHYEAGMVVAITVRAGGGSN